MRRAWVGGLAAIGVVGIASAVALWPRTRGAPPSDRVIAVLPFIVRGAPEFGYLAEGMVDLLSMSLNGAGELRSVDPHAVLGAVKDRGTGAPAESGRAPGRETGEQAGVDASWGARSGVPGEARSVGEGRAAGPDAGRGPDTRVDVGTGTRTWALDPEVGRTIARRLGAGLFVMGSVIEVGGRLRVHAGLYDDQGEVRALVEAASDDEAGIFQLVDELARKLLAGVYAGPGQRFSQLAALTAHSVDALKAYLEGEAAFRAGRFELAADAFARAVAIDTGFALAHFRHAVATEWNADATPGEIERTIARALRHAVRLPARDRRFLEGIAAYHRGASVEAEARFRSLLAADPDDVEAWLALGEVLFHAGTRTGRPGAMEDARSAFERVVALDPDHEEALLHLVRVYAWERRLPALDSVVDRLQLATRPGQPVLDAARALYAVAREDRAAEQRVGAELSTLPPIYVLVPVVFTAVYGRDPEAAARLAYMLTEPHRPARVRGAAHALLAELALARGDWPAAVVELDRADALHPELALQYRALLAAAPFVPVSDDEVEAILRRLESVDPAPEATSGAEDVPYVTFHPGLEADIRTYLVGLLHARLGRSADALLAAAALEAGDRPHARAYAAGIRATVALADDRPNDALTTLEGINFETWHQSAMVSPFVALARERFLRARALAEIGRDDEAARWYVALESSTPHDNHADQVPVSNVDPLQHLVARLRVPSWRVADNLQAYLRAS